MSGGTFIGNNGPNSLTGTAQNDLIRGRGGNDVLRGLGGSDRIFGDNGDDLLFGGNGDDRLAGGLGDDIVSGSAGDDVVDGGTGADTINGGVGDDLLRPGADLAADSVNGGAGTDTVDYSNATSGVTVDLQFGIVGAGAAAGDTYALVESVIGSNFADNLIARDGGTASGGGGDDSLAGAGDGSTTILVGGAGTDTLSGDSFGQELMQLELNNGADVFNDIFRETDADRLLVDNAVFNIGLGVTQNEIRNLATGPAVADIATAQFIYVQDTNEVFFDQDGTGGAFAPVLLATLEFEQGDNELLAGDFWVI
jgi:Ca2+-binding RTX toxin-like protein